MDPDPAIRRILERHLDDLVRPAVLHEKVRARVYRQLRKELSQLGYGWWPRRKAVRRLRKTVARMRREPSPLEEDFAAVLSVLGDVLTAALSVI